MENIILIGMPGVGKSTAGVILAKVLGYEFIDTDLVIQRQEKRLLREIISMEGVEGFMEIENRVNAKIQADHTVIATGGSVVYGTEAMEHLKSLGTVIYLQVSYEVLEARLSDIKGRGVVQKEGETLKDLYAIRTPLYEKYADMIISQENKTVEETVEMILYAYENRNKKQNNA